ncbi:MAG: hypothetical protein AB7G39_04230 [Alphaproteobacteria bacterium]
MRREIIVILALAGVLLGAVAPLLTPDRPPRVTEQAQVAPAGFYRTSGAERLIYRISSILSGPVTLPADAQARFQEGIKAGAAGLWEQAADAFDAAGEIAPYDPGLHYARAKAHQYAGNVFGAVVHLAIFTAEDEERGRTPSVTLEFGQRLLELQGAAEAILSMAWSIAGNFPPGSPERAEVLRLIAQAPTRRIADMRGPPGPPSFLERVTQTDSLLAAVVFANSATERLEEHRHDDARRLFELADRAAYALSDSLTLEEIDQLCSALRPPPPCRQVTTHPGLRGLPPVTERRCQRVTPLETLRYNEYLQLHAQALLAITMARHRAAWPYTRDDWWDTGNEWLDGTQTDYLCPLPPHLFGPRPLPTERGSNGGWPFDKSILDNVPPREGGNNEVPALDWSADLLYRTIELPAGRALAIGGHRSPFAREFEALEQRYDLADKIPLRLAEIGMDYLWLLHFALDRYEALYETVMRPSSGEGS